MKSGFLSNPPAIRVRRTNTPTLFPDSCTCAAMALESISGRFVPRIPFIVWMSLWTMRLVDVVVSTRQILLVANWFKMHRINTQAITAKMVKVHSVRNPANIQLIGEAVSQNLPSLACRVIDRDLPIDITRIFPVRIQVSSCPQETSTQIRPIAWKRAGNHLFFQPLSKWLRPYPLFPVNQMCNHPSTSLKFA